MGKTQGDLGFVFQEIVSWYWRMKVQSKDDGENHDESDGEVDGKVVDVLAQ
jgi:hypothetical protein